MKLRTLAGGIFILGVVVAVLSLVHNATGSTPGPGMPPQSVSTSGESQKVRELDAAIQEVIRQREYQWRLPREVVEEEEQSLLFEFLQGMMNTARRMWKPIGELWNKINRWLRRQLSSLGPQGAGREWTPGEMNLLILVLVASLALLILFFIWRHRKTHPGAGAIAAEAIQTVPDIADENTVADQLPEEGWQKLAKDLLARGELRLALRAMFMSTLAHLAQARLITIARFKSNREYSHEFKRRAYDQKEIQTAFDENVSAIDSVWYGMYPVTDDLLQRFRKNVEFVMKGTL